MKAINLVVNVYCWVKPIPSVRHEKTGKACEPQPQLLCLQALHSPVLCVRRISKQNWARESFKSQVNTSSDGDKGDTWIGFQVIDNRKSAHTPICEATKVNSPFPLRIPQEGFSAEGMQRHKQILYHTLLILCQGHT